jgi:4-hydroxybenzoate polyprenyltransferase
MELAIQDVNEGISIRKAALRRGVKRSTLQNRLHGRLTRNEAHQHRQKLSPDIEIRLVTWIINQEALGYAPSHGQVKGMVREILKKKGENDDLGIHWMDGFFHRHPDVKTKLGRRIDFRRLNGASPENINKFFNAYEQYQWIKPSNRYNTDEVGIMEGMGVNGLVVRSSQINPNSTYIKQQGSRNWSTILECVSAIGKSLTPAIIFKGGSVQLQWFKTEFKEPWYFTTSENGWTSNAIALEWLERVFIPETQPDDSSDARLLVVDGHGSHSTEEFMTACFENNIYLLFLPAHSSHVLQPLDVGVFSSLKTAYRKHLQKLTELNDSQPIGKANFLKCYAAARPEAIRDHTIKAGWRGTGLFPKNRLKALNSRQVARPTLPTLPAPQPPQTPQEITITTPKRTRDVLDLLESTPSAAFRRLRKRKVSEVMDGLFTENVLLRREIESFKERLEAAGVKKKKKVTKQDPNQRFVTMAEVLAEQRNNTLTQVVPEVDTQPVRRSGRARVPTQRAIEMYDSSEDSES